MKIALPTIPPHRLIFGIFGLACLLYANTIGHNYAWDDAIVITSNERVKGGIGNLPEFFQTFETDQMQDRYGYRPLVLITYALEISLFGLSPTVSHLVNVLLFALLCVILYRTLRALFPRVHWMVALLTTVLFIVHPLHVEVVANIKSRDEIMSLLFVLLSLGQFNQFQDTKSWKNAVGAAFLFLAGFLSKEGAAAFLPLYPVLLAVRSPQILGFLPWFKGENAESGVLAKANADNAPGGKSTTGASSIAKGGVASTRELSSGEAPAVNSEDLSAKKQATLPEKGPAPEQGILNRAPAWLRTAGILALSGLLLSIAFQASTDWLKVPAQEQVEGPKGNFEEDRLLGNSLARQHTFNQRIGTSMKIGLLYLKNFFVPYPLIHYYGFNQVEMSGLDNPASLLSLLLHLLLLAAGFWFWRRQPYIGTGLLWYLGTIIFYYHWFIILDDTMADRFMFLPSVGLCMALAGVLGIALGLIPIKKGALAAHAAQNSSRYAQSATQHQAETPNQITAKPQTRAEKRRKPAKEPKAGKGARPGKGQKAANRDKIFLNPKRAPWALASCILILAWAVLTLLRNPVWKDNMALFTADIGHQENCARCQYNYAGALSDNLPRPIAANDPRLEEVISHFKKSIEITDKAFLGYIGLGQTYMDLGRWEEAIAVLKKGVSKFPDRPRPRGLLGVSFFNSGRYQEALNQFKLETEFDPYRQDAWLYLGLSYFRTNQLSEAFDLLQKCSTRFTNGYIFLDALSDLYFEAGYYEDAMLTSEKVIGMAPPTIQLYQKLVKRYELIRNPDRANLWREKARNAGFNIP